ncbi:MAG: hypothetical protein V4466_11760, partial [Pseudomonadota bacterium]
MDFDNEAQAAGLSRRRLLGGSGVALGVLAAASIARAQEGEPAATDPDFHAGDLAAEPPAPVEPPLPAPDWQRVRAQWMLDWSMVDLSAMLFASNPKVVRDAIDRHRKGLDTSPITYLEARNRPLQNSARRMAGAYFGVDFENVALTESTTSAVAMVYAGIGLRYGQEALTTTHDYYVTHESLRLATSKTGGSVR